MARTKKEQEQTYIPGTEPVRIAEIDELAEARQEKKRKRGKLLDEIREDNEALLELMKKHGVVVYRVAGASPPLLLKRGQKDTLSIKEEKPSKGEEGDEE